MISLRQARAFFNLSLSETIEYRFQTLIWMLSGTEPLIMMFIWMELAKTRSIAGYSSIDFAAYFLTAFFVEQATQSGMSLANDILLGKLSAKLLKPIDPYWGYLIKDLANKLVRLMLLIVPLGLGFLLTGALQSLHASSILLFIFATIGASQLRFLERYNYGLMAFWAQSSGNLAAFMIVIFWAFSGSLIPIDLMPTNLQTIINLSPFPYMLSFPVQILLGKLSTLAIAKGFGILLFWLICFFIIKQVLWKHGLKRYGAFGA